MVRGQRDNSLRMCCTCCMDATYVASESRALQVHPACGALVSGLMNFGGAGVCLQSQLACASCLFVQVFPASGDPTPVSGFFFFSFSLPRQSFRTG